MKNIAKERNISLDGIFYVGNDVNDYYAMDICGYTACPSDSHSLIKNNVDYILKAKGGHGIVREILEDVFQLNILKLLKKLKDE